MTALRRNQNKISRQENTPAAVNTDGKGTMAETILEVSNLFFAYEEKNVLTDVSVSFQKGEKIAVMGANGAGKSTFFLNLNGVRVPSGGEICYRGTGINKKNRDLLRKNVGIVFQEADNQIVASTVRAEVAFGPMNLHLSREEVRERTMRAVERMNLSEYLDRPPHYLSGGEKKRVSIADILAMDSEIIIFDEPTASLDPVNARMLEEVLGQIEQEGRTVLLSTHDVDFAWRFADRILVFREGRLIGDGTPENIFGDAQLIRSANLKKPVLMEIWEILQKSGKVKTGVKPPKTLKEFQEREGLK